MCPVTVQVQVMCVRQNRKLVIEDLHRPRPTYGPRPTVRSRPIIIFVSTSRIDLSNEMLHCLRRSM